MIHVMLPVQYLRQAGQHIVDPQKRLMLAVLQRVVQDYRGDGCGRAAGGGRRATAEAVSYVTSTDRSWPFSFENVCEAVGLDADWLRRGLGVGR